MCYEWCDPWSWILWTIVFGFSLSFRCLEHPLTGCSFFVILFIDMKLDLTKLATALVTTLVVGVMTYQLTTIRQLEIDNEITKVRLEQIEKKLKKRGKNK